MLMATPYALKSSVSVADFRQFISALEGGAVAITKENVGGLSLLCDEFGFEELAAKLSEFRRLPAFKDVPTTKDTEARLRLSALEEQMAEQALALVLLQGELSRLSRVQEVTHMRRSGDPSLSCPLQC
jgi:hypothetical protein